MAADERTVLDATGLTCPLPILRARKVLNGLPAGAVLEVHASDPGAVMDFEAFCRQNGHTLVDHWAEADTHVFVIEKA